MKKMLALNVAAIVIGFTSLSSVYASDVQTTGAGSAVTQVKTAGLLEDTASWSNDLYVKNDTSLLGTSLASNTNTVQYSASNANVPEPNSVALLGLGLLGIATTARTTRRRCFLNRVLFLRARRFANERA